MTWREADRTPVLGRLFSEYLEKRLGPARKAEEPLEQRHRNIAASMQAALEEVLPRIGARWPRKPRKIAVPGGRCGFQLRRQRKNF